MAGPQYFCCREFSSFVRQSRFSQGSVASPACRGGGIRAANDGGVMYHLLDQGGCMHTYSSVLLPRAKSMRKKMTSAERRFWFECLKPLPYKFRKQRPVGRFIVDFYCAELKLVVEIDGDSHFNEQAKSYDKERTDYLTYELGLKVIRFTNEDIFKRINGVKEKLWTTIKYDPSAPSGHLPYK
jgi:very-short-patch-repair endonuclease